MRSLEIAGMAVIDRLVVTAHRAGCDPFYVVSEEPPAVRRARALGIETVNVAAPPRMSDAALFITGGVLVEAHDLERLIDRGGQLVRADGAPLPITMVNSNSSAVIARGVAAPAHDADSAREAERDLWASLTSNADGIVDRFFNRPAGRSLSKLLVHTPVSPNQVSVVSILIGIVSGWYFASGRFLTGAIILQICAIIDCVDGDLARALFKQSFTGKWLDLVGDQIVHFAVFLGIGIGVARQNPTTPALILGVSAAVGVVLCLLVILRGMDMPADHRSLFGKLVDATANRDFSALLLLLALIGKMQWFLWMAGIGIHLFWFAMLMLQMHAMRPRHQT
jgi:phosphatidylglycerophosphate synthase